jgi:hypothetical protein
MTNQEAAEAAQALGDHDDLGAEHLVKLAYKKGSDVCIIDRIVLSPRAVTTPSQHCSQRCRMMVAHQATNVNRLQHCDRRIQDADACP